MTTLFYSALAGQRYPQLVSGAKENDFILLALCQNGASGVADGKSWFPGCLMAWEPRLSISYTTCTILAQNQEYKIRG